MATVKAAVLSVLIPSMALGLELGAARGAAARSSKKHTTSSAHKGSALELRAVGPRGRGKKAPLRPMDSNFALDANGIALRHNKGAVGTQTRRKVVETADGTVQNGTGGDGEGGCCSALKRFMRQIFCCGCCSGDGANTQPRPEEQCKGSAAPLSPSTPLMMLSGSHDARLNAQKALQTLDGLKLHLDCDWHHGLEHGAQSTVIRLFDDQGRAWALKVFNKHRSKILVAGSESPSSLREQQHVVETKQRISKSSTASDDSAKVSSMEEVRAHGESIAEAYYRDITIPVRISSMQNQDDPVIAYPILYRVGTVAMPHLTTGFPDAPLCTWPMDFHSLPSGELQRQILKAQESEESPWRLLGDGDLSAFPMQLSEFATFGDLFKQVYNREDALGVRTTTEILRVCQKVLLALKELHQSSKGYHFE